MSPESLDRIAGLIFAWHAHTADRASFFQNLYLSSGTALYLLAAAAVATACVIRLFLAEHHALYWVEAGEIASGVVLYAAMQRGKWHQKWIDFRFLSERLRAVPFQHVAGIREISFDTPAWMRLSHLGDSWIAALFNRLCQELPRSAAPAELAPVKAFVAEAWIQDQVTYYKKAQSNLHHLENQLEGWGGVLAFATLAAAIVHATMFHEDTPFSDLFTAVAFIFPAVGGALGGIRAYRELRRNAERYHHTKPRLEELYREVSQAESVEKLQELIDATNHLMLREHQGWRLAAGVQPPGPG